MKDKKKSHYLERYLDHGNRLWSDFMQATRAYSETIYAFAKFSRKKKCITVFGSARFDENNKYYQIAYQLGSRLAQAGYSVMTGGGPGVMQGANKGAFEQNGKSFGCSMTMPHEEEPNQFLSSEKNFKYFFTRKLILTKYSSGFIILPGGFGTLDELFEIATLIKAKRIHRCPLVVMGKEYWTPLFDFIKYQMVSYNTIDQDMIDLFYFTDSIDDAIAYIEDRLGPTDN